MILQTCKDLVLSAVLIGCALLLVAKGVELVAFARAENAIEQHLSEATGGPSKRSGLDPVAAAIDRHVDKLILRARARQVSAVLKSRQVGAIDALLEAIEAYLRIAPMDASFWLWRGELAVATGDRIEAARDAFELARLLEPNEAGVKLARAKFGIRFWEILLPRQRRAAISDLIAIRSRLHGSDVKSLRALVSSKDDLTKRQIDSFLAETGQVSRNWGARIGL